MTVIAAAFAALAALIHAYIFVLESIVFSSRGRRAFGIHDDAEAAAVEKWAFNQGFYNLFLAIGAAVGAVLLVSGDREIGAVLVFLAAGSMVGAGCVLWATDRRMTLGAALQIVPSAIAIVGTVLAL